MATIADLEVKFSANTKGLSTGVAQANSMVSGLGSKVGGLAAVAGGFLVGQAIGNVALGVANLASSGLQFEANMANVNSIAQLTDQQLKGVTNTVLQLAKDPSITQGPATLAAGLYDIYSSGFAGGDAMHILDVSARAATAGLTTTDVAGKAITQTLNAYGLGAEEATRVSDVLFQTVNKGVITFPQLAQNMGNTLPLANALGVSIEELGASYALMTLKGVPASQAETQIASLMKSALNPTQALTDAMIQYGDGTAEATIANRGLEGYLKAVYKASGGSKTALMDMLGTQEAVNAALILGAEDGKQFNEMLGEMEKASDGAGATQKALEKQMESARFKVAEAKKQLEIFAATAMGAVAPAIGSLASGFSKGVMAMTGFIEGTISLGREAKLMYDTGGVLLESWLESLPGYLQPVGQLFFDLIDPIGDVGDALQAIREGNFGEAWDEITDAATGFFNAFQNLAGTVTDWVLDVGVPRLQGWIMNVAGDIWSGLKTLAGWTVDTAFDFGSWTLNVGLPAIEGAIKSVAGRAGDWLRGYLISGMSQVGDGTGGPDPTGANGSLTSLIGAWTLQVGIPKVVGAITSIAGRLGDWLRGYLYGGGLSNIPVLGGAAGQAGAGGGITVQIGQILIEVLDAVANISVSDVEGWVQERLDELGTIQAELREWEMLVTEDPEVTGNPQGKADKSLKDLFKAVLFSVPILGWSIMTLKDPDIVGDPIKKANDVLQLLVGAAELKVNDIGWVMGLLAPSTLLPSAFSFVDHIRKLIPPITIPAVKWLISLAVPDINIPSGDQIKAAIRVAGEAVGIPGWILDRALGGGGGDFDQGVTGGPGNAGSPRVPPGSSEGDGYPSVGGAPVHTLPNTGVGPGAGGAGALAQVQAMAAQITAAVNQMATAARAGVVQVMQAFQPLGQQISGILTPIPNIIRTTATQMQQGWQQSLQQLPATTRTVFTQLAQSVTQSLAPLPGQARSSATQVATGITQAFQPLPGQVRSTFTQVATAVTSTLAPLPGQARSAGSQTATGFTGGLQAISAARGIVSGAVSSVQGVLSSASSGAYGYGYAVGDQFAAGLEASVSRVIAAAGALRNAMPSSPAKTGPLSKPISFAYIIEDLEKNMARMGPTGLAGVKGLQSSLRGGSGLQVSGTSTDGLSTPSASGGSYTHIAQVVVDIRGWEELRRMQRTLSPQGATAALGISF